MDICKISDFNEAKRVLESLSSDYDKSILSSGFKEDDEKTRRKCIDTCLNQGGILIGETDLKPKLFLGYTFGEPSRNFTDKDTFYIYLLLLAKPE